MPSMKCYECKKVKRCRMHMTNAGDDKVVASYLCNPCARALGYFDEGGEG
jgi:protein-arginine kinase activator protein McsA